MPQEVQSFHDKSKVAAQIVIKYSSVSIWTPWPYRYYRLTLYNCQAPVPLTSEYNQVKWSGADIIITLITLITAHRTCCRPWSRSGSPPRSRRLWTCSARSRRKAGSSFQTSASSVSESSESLTRRISDRSCLRYNTSVSRVLILNGFSYSEYLRDWAAPV